MTTVTLAEAEARLSELVEHAAGGDTIRIVSQGKPVAQLTAISTPRKPADFKALRALTKTMLHQDEPARKFIRRVRNEERY